MPYPTETATMSIKEITEEAAHQYYNDLTDGLDVTTPSLPHRNSKALCLLLAILNESGLITAADIDALIAEAKR